MEPISSHHLLFKLRGDLKEIVRQVMEEFVPLDLQQLNEKEHSEKWSILECFQHLNLYARYYLQHIDLGIQGEKSKGLESSAIYKPTWIGKLSIQSVHPQNRKKQKTFKQMNPINSKLDKGVLDEFLIHQGKLQELVESARMININKGKVSVEFFRLLKMNIGDTLQFIVVHQQRHLLQAMEVKSKVRVLRPVLSL